MKKIADKPPLTAAQAEQLDALTGKPDLLDIPEAPLENWLTAERGKFFKSRKEAISLRLDMDVLDWLRHRGTHYQTDINNILREKMERERAGKPA